LFLEFLAAGLLEIFDLVHDILGLEIAHTDCLDSAIDVVSLDDGVLVGPWRNAEFDLGIGSGEIRKLFFEEGAIFFFGCQLIFYVGFQGDSEPYSMPRELPP
jgi:hypothetical protein